MTHVETSNAHKTNACDEQSSVGLQKRVRVATFASLRNLKDVEVLKIQDCTNFDDCMSGLSSEDFCEFFRSNADLFLVAIEVDGSLTRAMKQNFDLKDFEFERDGGTWIVQITSTTESSSMIFFKDPEFSHIYIANGKIINQGQRCEENHFDELVKEILPDILRCPQLNLLDLSLTLDQKNYFIEKGNLCQKLINLHNSETGPASKRRKVETETEFTIEQLEEMIVGVDGRNYNMLMNAIEEKNERLIDTLIKLDFDLSHFGSDGKRAVDLAIDNEMFDVFVKLIEADSPFPEATQLEKVPMQSNAFTKLFDVFTERGEFHDFIGVSDIDGLKTKISQNPKLKFAYDLDNKSALTCALEQERFEIFSFLLHAGFSKGVDPFYDEVFGRLTGDEKNSIASFNLNNYGIFTSAHVYSLVNKTKIASKVPNKSKSYEEVRMIYNDLDAIPQVSEVLQIVALHEYLTISFDFESFDVHKMHPSLSQNTEGVFFEGGFIFIAAGQWQSDRNEVLGVIAHEFTHCAMNKIYKNRCKPYSVDDKDREKEFEQIVAATETVVEFEENPEKIISLVYDKYPRKAWSIELIVRVPHLLARYKDDDDKIYELKATFVDLFKFYETKTRPDHLRHLEIARFAEKVKTLNDEAGLLTQIRNEEIDFKTSQSAACFEGMDESKITVVVSNSSIHSMAAMIEYLDQNEILHIAIELRFFEQKFSKNRKIFQSNHQLVLMVNCADQNGRCSENFFAIIRSLKKCKIVLIVDDSEQQNLSELIDGNSCVSEFHHKWQDLTESYQTRIMQKFVKFHGNPISLGDLLISDDSCPALDVLPLNEFVGQKQLTVSEKAVKPSKFYFPRRFFIESARYQEFGTDLTSDDLVAGVKREGFAIISGIAGSGKSTVLKEITDKLKQNFLDRWVRFVDLKQHFIAFSRWCSTSIFVEFAFRLTSSKSQNENFELELFKHFYANGKVLLLLDGFDEISPHYKEIVSDFLSKFEPKRGNQLWITTRSHLQEYLEELLEVPSIQLSPFNEDEKIEFLLKYWRKGSEVNNSEPRLDPKLESYAQLVVKNLNEFLNSHGGSVGIPLLMEIVASTYKKERGEQNLPENAKTYNLYSLYEQFFDRKLKIWRQDQGQLSQYEQTQADKSGNAVLEVHEKLAIELLFEPDEVDEFRISNEYDKIVWSEAALVRVGLVLCSSDSSGVPEFLHRTFAEFLVARFIMKNLKSEKQTQALKVFFKILIKEEVVVVCQFLNFALRMDEMTNLNVEQLADNIKKCFENKIVKSIPAVIFSQDLEKLFRLYIEIAEKIINSDGVKELLQRIDTNNDNLVMNLSQNARKKLINEVFHVLGKYLSHDEIKKLVVGFKKPNYLHCAAASNTSDSLQVLHENVKHFLSDEELKTNLKYRDGKDRNLFWSAIENKNHDTLSSLIEFVKPFLSVDEIKEMLQGTDTSNDNLTIALLQNGRTKSIKEVFSVLEKYLQSEGIKKLLIDSENLNCLQVAVVSHSSDYVIELHETVKTFLSGEEQKAFLRVRDGEERNMFWSASENENHETLSSLIEIAKQVLSDHEIKTMLKETDDDGRNIVCSIFGRRNSLKSYKVLKSILNDFELDKLVLHVDDDGNNFMFYALNKDSGCSEIIQTLFDNIKVILPNVQQEQLLRMRNQKKQNIFAASFRDIRNKKTNYRVALRHLIDNVKKILHVDEIRTMLVECKLEMHLKEPEN